MHDGQPEADAVPASAGGFPDEGFEKPVNLVAVRMVVSGVRN